MAADIHTCICCRLKSADLVRWGFKNYTHAECGLERFGQTFLNHLTLEQLEAIPEALLRKHDLYEAWEALLKRKQQYSGRSDLSAGRHSVRFV